MLSLNWNLLFTIINLIVLYLLMKKFLIGPVMGIMEQRKAIIEEGFADAGKANEDAQKMKQQYEESLKNARQESERIMATARTEAKNEYNRIVEEAGEKAGRLLEGARQSAQAEQAQTMKELQSEIAGLAMSAAAKIVGENVEAKETSAYDQFLQDVQIETEVKKTENKTENKTTGNIGGNEHENTDHK